jgi:hypothetical protein
MLRIPATIKARPPRKPTAPKNLTSNGHHGFIGGVPGIPFVFEHVSGLSADRDVA